MNSLKSSSICLILSFFLSLQNCKVLEFFQEKAGSSKPPLANFYSSPPLKDFNPRFFDESSLYRSFLHIREDNQVGRIDKWEITVVKFNPSFRHDTEKYFPEAKLPSYQIEIKILSGKSATKPSSTGFEVVYTSERTRMGEGSSLDSAWNQFQKSGFTQSKLERKEKWEAIKDGLWLAEESENLEMGSLRWKHKPGSLDFLHPISEFKSNNNLTASLYYDYSLNRFEKLNIEKIPDSENLVFKGDNSSLHFIDGQLTIVYNQ